jgi:hypothetical protein
MNSLFRFVVRHLRWLAHLPLAPQFFDSLLLSWTALVDRPRLRAMEALESAALQLPDVAPCIHRFGGIGFAHHGTEFAHLHGNGLLDVHLTRERAATLVATGRAEQHHVLGPSAWISFSIGSQMNVKEALGLIEEGLHLVRLKEKASAAGMSAQEA